MDDKLKNIFNYLKLSENLATAGQPSEEELTLISKTGFEVVINLALHDADYSLDDESMSIERLGMQYEHLPVIWENPTEENLERFFELMDEYENRKRFVHCAANMRVSVFMALYRILKQGWSYNEAMQDVHKIWQPNEIWSGFIKRSLSNQGGKIMSAKNIVNKYLDAFFGGRSNLAAVRALLTDDFTFQGPLMTASSADDFIQQLEAMGSGMQMHAEILHVIDEGDCVAALYDFMGPEGKISFAEWYWVRGNKISAIKLHYDPRPLLEAMGTEQ